MEVKTTTVGSAVPTIWVNWARAKSTLCQATSRWTTSTDDPEDDPHNVVDGSNYSYWASETNVPLVDFVLDFQTQRLIDHVYIAFGSQDMKCRNAPGVFIITTSEDGEEWNQLSAGGDNTNVKYGEVGKHLEGKSALCLDFAEPVKCQFVKVQFQQLGFGWLNHALHQIQCWGPADALSASQIMGTCRGYPSMMYATDIQQMKQALMLGTNCSKMGINIWSPPALPPQMQEMMGPIVSMNGVFVPPPPLECKEPRYEEVPPEKKKCSCLKCCCFCVVGIGCGVLAAKLLGVKPKDIQKAIDNIGKEAEKIGAKVVGAVEEVGEQVGTVAENVAGAVGGE